MNRLLHSALVIDVIEEVVSADLRNMCRGVDLKRTDEARRQTAHIGWHTGAVRNRGGTCIEASHRQVGGVLARSHGVAEGRGIGARTTAI